MDIVKRRSDIFIAVGLIIGFIFGVHTSTICHGFSDHPRLHQHRALWPRPEWHVTNTGAIHDGLGRDFRVCLYTVNIKHVLTAPQLLHGHRHHDPNRQLAHCHRGLQQNQPPTHGPTATLPKYARFSRREELDEDDLTKVAGAIPQHDVQYI
jgi:hypothetical protein